MALSEALRNLLGLFLKAVCPGCGWTRPEDGEFCRWCMLRMDPCRLSHWSGNGEPVRLQPDDDVRFGPRGIPVHSALHYRGVPGEMVVRLKFGGESHLAAPAAWLIRRFSPALPAAGELLVPIPSGPSTRRRRGYSQASLIARKLASLLECRTEELLERDDGPSQIGLPSDERRKNVRGVFRLRRTAGRELSAYSGRIWLVDDVATTFSTIHSAAGALSDRCSLPLEGITLAYRGRTSGSIVP